jgi:hypothetical protein
MTDIIEADVASAFGAIDSDAAQNGKPTSAKLERTLAMQSNFARVRPTIMSNVALPRESVDESVGESSYVAFQFEGPADRKDGLIMPWYTPRSPGNETAQVRMIVWAPTGAVVNFAFRDGHNEMGTATLVGDGTVQSISTTLRLERNPVADRQRIELWVRGSTTDSLADTNIVGGPNTWVGDCYGAGIDTFVNWTNLLYTTSPSWLTDIANGGYRLVCNDTVTGNLVFEKKIVGLQPASGGQRLIYERIWEGHIQNARNLSRAGNDPTFSIRPICRFALFNVAVLGDA